MLNDIILLFYCLVDCIKFIANCLKKALNNKKIRRHRGFATVELVDGMAHLAVNDDNKQKVRVSTNFKIFIESNHGRFSLLQ